VGGSSSCALNPAITQVRMDENKARISIRSNLVNKRPPQAEPAPGKPDPKFPRLPTPVSARAPSPPQKNHSYCLDSKSKPWLPAACSPAERYRLANPHIKKPPPKITAIEAT
jgi:hypothetical protein